MHMVPATFDLFHRNNQGIVQKSIVRCIDMKICIIWLNMTIYSYKEIRIHQHVFLYVLNRSFGYVFHVFFAVNCFA